jgi:ubiquinone/menaquinone biosynthesis C-methylase UbiE
MQVSADWMNGLPQEWWQTAYRTHQWGKQIFGLMHRMASTQATRWFVSVLRNPEFASEAEAEGQKPFSVSEATVQEIQSRYEKLLDVDLNEAEAGYYPPSLLFDTPWGDFFQYYPQLWLEIPEISQRVAWRQYQSFDSSINTEGYPPYYLQNFHHQTNGYLSAKSAHLYDLQVDLLFGGSTDAMRRRIIRPLKTYLSTPEPLRMLDVATGTGRTLRLLRAAFPHPQTSLCGLDLSPAYLRKANDVLRELPNQIPQLVQANAESIPFADATFEAVTCVFLFHELPRAARQQVIHEISRVLKPGGIAVVCDSIQMGDSPELQESMQAFAQIFHEPYYRDYICDNLTFRFQQAGCEVLEESSHYLSHYITVRKLA